MPSELHVRRPVLWRTALACMAGCLAPWQLISPCYQLHPKTGLIPEVEGTDSLPKSELPEAHGLPANNLSQNYAMSTSDSNTTFQFLLGQCLIWYVSSLAKTVSVWIRQIQVVWVHLCTFLHEFLCNNLGVGFCKTLLPVINSTISGTDAGIPAAEGAVLNKIFRFIAEKKEDF